MITDACKIGYYIIASLIYGSCVQEEKASWLWKIPPPNSRRQADTGDVGDGKPRTVRRKTQMMSVSERLLKGKFLYFLLLFFVLVLNMQNVKLKNYLLLQSSVALSAKKL